MNIYFVDTNNSKLSDIQPDLLRKLRSLLVNNYEVKETFDPKNADAILIQEDKKFKNFNHIKFLLEDPIISAFPEKVYTINSDDYATGLLRGLYTCLPQKRQNSFMFKNVPYAEYPNQLLINNDIKVNAPLYLGSWRGNLKSNKIRDKMVKSLKPYYRCKMEWTESWLNHSKDEKKNYLHLMKNSKFSLCPAGWAPASYRIYESMAMGRCPVIIADEFLPPDGPEWHSFALFFPEKKIEKLYSYLLSKEHLAEAMGNNAHLAWQKYFSPNRVLYYYAESLLSLINKTPRTTKEREIKRWKSYSLFHSNKWTLPQRIINRITK